MRKNYLKDILIEIYIPSHPPSGVNTPSDICPKAYGILIPISKKRSSGNSATNHIEMHVWEL